MYNDLVDFENTELRRIFKLKEIKSKRKKGRKLDSEELHDFYSLRNIKMIIKLNRIQLT
jgi:hypothetical protein